MLPCRLLPNSVTAMTAFRAPLLEDDPDDWRVAAARGVTPMISFTRAAMSSDEVSKTASAPMDCTSSAYALLRTCLHMSCFHALQ